jgi:transposase
MLLHAMDCNNARAIVWAIPPWDRQTPAWLDIDQKLESNDVARLVDRLVAGLDLTELRMSYAGRGSRPHRPELLLRLVLFETLEGDLSPKRWYRDSRKLDPAKWLLFGAQPSLSSLYAFRDRCAPILVGLNRQVLRIAQAEGLLIGNDVAFDGTFVAARGSRHRLLSMKVLDRRIGELDAAIAADYAAADLDTPDGEEAGAATPCAELASPLGSTSLALASTPEALAAGASTADIAPTEVTASPSSSPPAPAGTTPESTTQKSTHWIGKTPATRRRQRMTYRAAQEILHHRRKCHEQSNSRTAKAKRRSTERIVICPTEPEAVLGRDKVHTFRPLYNVQFARDLDTHFVVGYDVVPKATDAGQFGPLAGQVENLLGHLPKRTTVDEKYAGQVDLALARELEILVYAPTSATKQADASRKKPNKGMIPKQDFVWHPEEQTYYCPQGHRLKCVGASTQTRQGGETITLTQYRCPPEHCQVCPVKAQCTRTPERGRIVKRGEHDDLVDALRDRMERPEGKELYRKRKQTVEQSYADLKEHRGLRQFHGFGLTRARAQVAMVVLAVNGRGLLTARDRARTKPPNANGDAA